jgi:multidrug efflux pump subunit AcrA (membrane-fusion protein)
MNERDAGGTNALTTIPPSPEQLDETVATTVTRGWIALVAAALVVALAIVWSFVAEIPEDTKATAVVAPPGDNREVLAGAEGSVTVTVQAGDVVTAGQPVAELTAFGPNPPPPVPVNAPVAGVVREIFARNGAGVTAKDPVVSITPSTTTTTTSLVAYLPASQTAFFVRGATVSVTLTNLATDTTRVVPAQVTAIASVPSTETSINATLQSPTLTSQIMQNAGGLPYRINFTLQDVDTLPATDQPVPGMVAEVNYTYARRHPIDILFGPQ